MYGEYNGILGEKLSGVFWKGHGIGGAKAVRQVRLWHVYDARA